MAINEAAHSDSVVDLVYEQIKALAVSYDLKPGERLNEGDLARRLGVSRTPLREALNRLSIEGFFRFTPGKGFFCRELDADEIFALYELRKALETSAVKLAISRAKNQDIEELFKFLNKTGPEPGERSSVELVRLDEIFHERLMEMADNPEMLRVLRNINARIRFLRWIDMDGINRVKTQAEHREILLGVQARDANACVAILEGHIDRRLDQITGAIKEGYAQIYMPAERREGI